jgi:hypothetical protein
MGDRSPSEDPGQWAASTRRVWAALPKWITRLGLSIAWVVLRVSLPFYRRRLPQHLGFSLWTGGENADIYEKRLKGALDLLATQCPTHLRWLRGSLPILSTWQSLRVARASFMPGYKLGILGVNPYTAWNITNEQLALYFVAFGTRARMARSVLWTPARKVRGQRRALLEMVACARHFPNSQPLVAEWEKHLREFERRYGNAAA